MHRIRAQTKRRVPSIRLWSFFVVPSQNSPSLHEPFEACKPNVFSGHVLSNKRNFDCTIIIQVENKNVRKTVPNRHVDLEPGVSFDERAAANRRTCDHLVRPGKQDRRAAIPRWHRIRKRRLVRRRTGRTAGQKRRHCRGKEVLFVLFFFPSWSSESLNEWDAGFENDLEFVDWIVSNVFDFVIAQIVRRKKIWN